VGVAGLDHVVLGVSDWETSNAFYRDVLGVDVVELDLGRTAYRLPDGRQLNVHGPGATPQPRARDPVHPGSSDLCFTWDGTPEAALEHLRACGVERMDIQVDPENARSIRIPEKLGYTLEGTLRRRLPPKSDDGPRRDSLLFTMVREELAASPCLAYGALRWYLWQDGRVLRRQFEARAVRWRQQQAERKRRRAGG
jgi:catechol 2,3-dioxygenase-like lactoylglutathione lyase family enzyme